MDCQSHAAGFYVVLEKERRTRVEEVDKMSRGFGYKSGTNTASEVCETCNDRKPIQNHKLTQVDGVSCYSDPHVNGGDDGELRAMDDHAGGTVCVRRGSK